MSRTSFRRLAQVGLFGLPLLGLGCSQFRATERIQPDPMLLAPSSPVDPAMSFSQAEVLVEPYDLAPAAVRASAAPTVVATHEKQQLPIGLDTVLRLAEEQNPQIGSARSKVGVAFAEKEAASARWLPDIYLGVGYYRHAGGIQLQEGPLVRTSTGALLANGQINAEYNPRDFAFKQIDAARKIWQNQGELAKVTVEQLLEASTTYVDLLAAHAALAVSKELEVKIDEVLVKAIKTFDMFKTADVEIQKNLVEAELQVQKQAQRKLRGQIDAASAKLVYLLGLDSSAELVPIDSQMAAFHLIDVSRPVEDLVAQALSTGPGIRELEGILCLIQTGLDTAKTGRYVPVVKFQMGEGLFAAGPFGTLDWSNRWDMGLQARWNVSELFTAKSKRNVAFAQINQVQMTVQELRARLTLGVQEARTTIESSAEQFPGSEELIKIARRVVEKVQARVDDNVQPVTFSDLVNAHKAVGMAQLSYVDQMREYDKAQLRLLVLLGSGSKMP